MGGEGAPNSRVLEAERCRLLPAAATLYGTARSWSPGRGKLAAPELSFPDGLIAEHRQQRMVVAGAGDELVKLKL